MQRTKQSGTQNRSPQAKRVRMRAPLAAGAAAGLCALSCLPSDTRPEPATIRVAFGLASPERLQGSALEIVTDDGYQVSFSSLLVSAGIVEFDGDDCKPYGDLEGYVRVMNPLQPDEQPLSLNYALGQCSVGFRLRPPEVWAVVNPGASEADRAALRAAPFDNVDREGFGNGGPLGASLRVIGSAHPVGDPDATTPFRFEFGMESRPPRCSPRGEPWFSFSGGSEVELKVELAPEALFRTCEAAPRVLFGAFAEAAAALPLGAEARLTQDDLADLRLEGLPEAIRGAYTDLPLRCPEGSADSNAATNTEAPPESSPARPPDTSDLTLRDWLTARAAGALLGLQDAQCEP